MVKNSFSHRLNKAILEKNSRLCVGLDPRLDRLPAALTNQALKEHGPTNQAAAAAITIFNRQVIEAVAEYAACVKPQIAFYEQYGAPGLEALWQTIDYATQHNLEVILDAKRGDIGSTAAAYAQGYLGGAKLFGKTQTTTIGALTVNPFLGRDSLEPFIEAALKYGKGLFILVKTSNPGSGDIQDLVVDGQSISERVATFINERDFELDEYGYHSFGAVVGATFPEAAKKFRSILSRSIFLMPGFGAQGADPALLRHFFNNDGLGAIINSSRAITFCFETEDQQYLSKIKQSAKDSCLLINQHLA